MKYAFCAISVSRSLLHSTYPHEKEDCMDQAAEKLLKHFVQVCHNVTLCPEDWRRLYRFTLDNHRRGLNTDHRMVREYLVKEGCSLQKASWLSAQYHHFIQLLSLYDHEKSS